MSKPNHFEIFSLPSTSGSGSKLKQQQRRKLMSMSLFSRGQVLILTFSLFICSHFDGVSSGILGPAGELITTSHQWETLDGMPAKLVGHRGEKVYMPEHTVGSYEIACLQQPDYVEPDLAMTKDGTLVCYHDLTLKDGTNIAKIPELASYKKNWTGLIGGVNVTILDDWFITDLTHSQLRLLRVRQKKIGVRPQYFNQNFHIPTFQEYLDVIHKMAHKMGTPFGIIPELKHPEFVNTHWSNPFHMENELMRALQKGGYAVKDGDQVNCSTPTGVRVPCGHVIIQCFNKTSLEYLANHTKIPLLFSVDDNPHYLTLNSLGEVSKFASYYSVWKEFLVSGVEQVLTGKGVIYNKSLADSNGGFIQADRFAVEAHKRGLSLAIYTIYDSREPSRRGCDVKCLPENKTEELFNYFRMGVDTIFVENIKEATDLRLNYDFVLRSGGEDLGSRISLGFMVLTSFVGVIFGHF